MNFSPQKKNYLNRYSMAKNKYRIERMDDDGDWKWLVEKNIGMDGRGYTIRILMKDVWNILRKNYLKVCRV